MIYAIINNFSDKLKVSFKLKFKSSFQQVLPSNLKDSIISYIKRINRAI